MQLFYYGHCPNEISGMGCGGGNRIVATGERVSKGDACSIHVWSSDTCSSLRILPPFHLIPTAERITISVVAPINAVCNVPVMTPPVCITVTPAAALIVCESIT